MRNLKIHAVASKVAAAIAQVATRVDVAVVEMIVKAGAVRRELHRCRVRVLDEAPRAEVDPVHKPASCHAVGPVAATDLPALRIDPAKIRIGAKILRVFPARSTGQDQRIVLMLEIAQRLAVVSKTLLAR